MRNLARNGSRANCEKYRTVRAQSPRERGISKLYRDSQSGIGAIAEKCITIGEPFYPVERDNESSFCVLYENAPEGFVKLRGIEGTFSQTINSPRIYLRLPALLHAPLNILDSGRRVRLRVSRR